MLPELEEELLVLEEKLEKAVGHLSAEYVTVRAGRANPKILDNIVVDYYGSPTPLRQMANMDYIFSPIAALIIFPSPARSNVMMGILFSIHVVIAVVSICDKRRFITSR